MNHLRTYYYVGRIDGDDVQLLRSFTREALAWQYYYNTEDHGDLTIAGGVAPPPHWNA